jgi:hypothetical protein
VKNPILALLCTPPPPLAAAVMPTPSQLAFDSYRKKENKVSEKCVNFDMHRPWLMLLTRPNSAIEECVINIRVIKKSSEIKFKSAYKLVYVSTDATDSTP